MPSVPEDMNTAVPETRGSGVSAMSCRNNSSGIVPLSIVLESSRRPRHHVVMITKTPAPTASGNQPPAAIFTTFAEKNERSISTNGMNSSSAAGSE